MGKNVEIKNPDAAMSPRQSYMLYLMTGIDVRETDLTKGLASGLIDQIVNGKCYHARVTCAGLDNAVLKRQDVHKSHRKDAKPRGYAVAMAEANGEEAPTPKKPATKQPTRRVKKANAARKAETTPKVETLAEELGLEPVDLDNPRIKRMLDAFAAM